MIVVSKDGSQDHCPELSNYISEFGLRYKLVNKFCFQIAAKFMVEDDVEQMKEELKEAFRIYDKEGQGFITTDVLKEILREIDATLTEDDLDNIIEEVDDDASGTLDFDEFQAMMMGQVDNFTTGMFLKFCYSTICTALNKPNI